MSAETPGSRVRRAWTSAVALVRGVPWTAFVAAAAVLAVGETVRAFLRTESLPISGLSRASFPLATFATILGLLLAHGLPVWLVGGALSPRRRTLLLTALGLAFGFGWHLTLLQGDGIRASKAYWMARIVLAVVIPGGLAAFVYTLAGAGITTKERKRLLLALVTSGAVVINLFVWPSYRAFHGFLAAFVAGCLVVLLMPLARVRAARRTAVVLVAVVLVMLPFLPGRRLVEGNVRRLTRAAGPMLSVLPLSAPFLLKAVPLVPAELRVTPAEAARFEAEHEQQLRAATRDPPRGRNVLLLVLESTRWDVWQTAAITPRFHQWRQHGLYVPAAVAQYPATPLAYGALFAAQTPSVLAQVPYWSSRRLFDVVGDRFRHRFFTRPDIMWFDHAAINSFFMRDGDPVHKHTSSEHGLAFLRRQLERQGDGSFFALAHLYEPHDPWEEHRGFLHGSDIPGRYRSEVAFLDAQLGVFMEWFFAQPFARDTLVIAVGDHGEGLGELVHGEPFIGHHVHVSGVVSRVPFFAAGPGIPANTVRRDLPLAQMDVMPTIFDFLGEPPPRELVLHGRSLWTVLEDPAPRDLPTEAFSIRGAEFFDLVRRSKSPDSRRVRERFRQLNEEGTYAPKVALQRGRWKIAWDSMLDRFWLHDVVLDPYERVDLSAKRPEILKEMRSRLRTWRREQAWRIRKLEALEGTAADHGTKPPGPAAPQADDPFDR